MADDKKELSNIEFSKDAADYDQSKRYDSLRETYPAIVTEAVSSPFAAILDIGCGTGALLRMIQEKRKDARLSGVDLSEKMIQVAKGKLGKKADLRVSDSEKLPFPNGAFDLVMCTYSFHHYPNPGAVLSEVRRVLAPSGRLILVDPTTSIPLVRQVANFRNRFTKDGTVRIYSKKEMKTLVEAAGFTVAKWSMLNWHSYMMVAQ
jgi:ubiquinone/menaquinone biosynthesis C-methylase UbiE